MRAAEFQKQSSEATIQAAICELLTLKRIPFSVTDSSRVIGPDGRLRRRKVSAAGWPDITACLPGGRLLAIEVKSASGRLRISQRAVLERLQQQGALVVIARDVSDVASAIKEEPCHP
ncbi:MAG TPA: VRR-NUC domain-containing protein [Blastocatellia bacterium]|nr:VRR-NUC domain-containing protein [Blastocatellia bacterium]